MLNISPKEKYIINDTQKIKIIKGDNTGGKTEFLIKYIKLNLNNNNNDNILFITKNNIDAYYAKEKIEKYTKLKFKFNKFIYETKTVKIINCENIKNIKDNIRCILIDDNCYDFNDIKFNYLNLVVTTDYKTIIKKTNNMKYYYLNKSTNHYNFKNFIKNNGIINNDYIDYIDYKNEKDINLFLYENMEDKIIELIDKIDNKDNINEIAIITNINGKNISDKINRYYENKFNLYMNAIEINYEYMDKNYIDISTLKNKTIITNLENYRENTRKYIIVIMDETMDIIKCLNKSNDKIFIGYKNKNKYNIIQKNNYNLFKFVNIIDTNNIFPFIEKKIIENHINIEQIKQINKNKNFNKTIEMRDLNDIFSFYIKYDDIYLDGSNEKQNNNCIKCTKNMNIKNKLHNNDIYYEKIKCKNCNKINIISI
jgi:hypothetical protein